MRLYQGGTTTEYWLLSDHLGSQSITANADGSLNSEVRYSAFGETRYTSATETPTDYLFTGQRIEEEAGLYYYNARFFDPVLSHFVQADTMAPEPGNALSYEKYAYVNFNPIRLSDPSGHVPEGEGSGYDHWRQVNMRAKLGAIGFLKYEIRHKFGIKVKDGTDIKWSEDNLNTAYQSLSVINDTLGGNLKDMVDGSIFQIAGQEKGFSGITGPTGITFYVEGSSTDMPDIHFFHEIGHLLDCVPDTYDVFSDPLHVKTPDWVDSEGFVDRNILFNKYTRPVESYYMIKDGKHTEAFNENEYWADAFANYMAGNINLIEPAGQQMYNYVRDALSPFAN